MGESTTSARLPWVLGAAATLFFLLHGTELGFERAYSTHNNYWLWGPPTEPFEVAIVIGNDEAGLRELFWEVELFRRSRCEYGTPWRDGLPIWLVAGPRVDFAQRWPAMKSFG